MKINHNDAISLESTVRRVFACQRSGMGGYIDADHFESEPFDAALIALAPLWQYGDSNEIEDFLFKWEHALRHNVDEEVDIELYDAELYSLVEKLMKNIS